MTVGKTYFCHGNHYPPVKHVGGIHGYRELLEALARGGPEAEEYRSWLDLGAGEQWETDHWSVREVNSSPKDPIALQ